MSIFRTSHNKENPYVMLNKAVLEDRNLSWGAKGLWAYLMSKPDNWNISASHLAKVFLGKKGGERAIYSLINELIAEGYCKRTQSNEGGSFGKVIYDVLEFKISLPHRSQADAPQADATQADALESDAYNNKGSIENNEAKREEREGEKAPPPSFLHFGTVFKVTQENYDSLIKDFGEQKIAEYIERFNNYCLIHGKENKYKRHDLVIRDWLKDDMAKSKMSPPRPQKTSANDKIMGTLDADLSARLEKGGCEVPLFAFKRILQKSIADKNPDLARGYRYKNEKGEWVIT
jgi:hypothetical protein